MRVRRAFYVVVAIAAACGGWVHAGPLVYPCPSSQYVTPAGATFYYAGHDRVVVSRTAWFLDHRDWTDYTGQYADVPFVAVKQPFGVVSASRPWVVTDAASRANANWFGYTPADAEADARGGTAQFFRKRDEIRPAAVNPAAVNPAPRGSIDIRFTRR